MSTPVGYFCLDGDVANGINPFRPGVDTVGGVSKENEVGYPANPVTMPMAEDFNQQNYLLVALAKVAPLARIVIRIVSGQPTVYAVLTMSNLLTTADFTIVAAADGNFAITCPATKIPAPLFGAVHCQSTSHFDGNATPNGGGNGLEVRTWNAAGSLADTDCVVDWC